MTTGSQPVLHSPQWPLLQAPFSDNQDACADPSTVSESTAARPVELHFTATLLSMPTFRCGQVEETVSHAARHAAGNTQVFCAGYRRSVSHRLKALTVLVGVEQSSLSRGSCGSRKLAKIASAMRGRASRIQPDHVPIRKPDQTLCRVGLMIVVPVAGHESLQRDSQRSRQFPDNLHIPPHEAAFPLRENA